MDEIAANALCFFIPEDVSWSEFKALDTRDAVGWDQISALDKITVFIPAFAAPHEIRSCILEEVTQALGPGNDLRDLDDSIFNDDNAHVWPTAFDLLILRTLYSSQLRNGLSYCESVTRARNILRSEQLGSFSRKRESIGTEYDDALTIAEDGTDPALRNRAAQAAISLAKTQGGCAAQVGRGLQDGRICGF